MLILSLFFYAPIDGKASQYEARVRYIYATSLYMQSHCIYKMTIPKMFHKVAVGCNTFFK